MTGGDTDLLVHSYGERTDGFLFGAEADALSEIGGKALGLTRLFRSGLPVPEFFVVGAGAFREHLRGADVAAAIGEVTLALGEAQGAIPDDVAERTRAAIEGARLDRGLSERIDRRLRSLGPGPFAVRSSMAGEDSDSHSFAGQLDSYLYQRDLDEVCESVARCWGSVFSPHALAYATRAGMHPGEIRLAVVVQQMVEPEVSGVLFTANPVSGKHDEMLLTAAYGLGEGVVSGLCDSDEYVWSESGGERGRRLADKREKVARAASGRGTELVAVEADARGRAALSDAQIEQICRAGMTVAAERGHPVDVEWSYADGDLLLLQARPITTLSPAPETDGPVRVFDNSNVQESYNGVTTPLTFSFASRAYTTVFRQFAETLGVSREDMTAFEPSARTLIGIQHGRIYYNLGSWLDLISLFPNSDGKREDLEKVMWHTAIDPVERSQGSLRERLGKLIRTARVGGRLLRRFATLDREIERFLANFDRVYESVDRKALPDATLSELQQLSVRLYSELLERWEAPNINDWRVMASCGRLRRLLVRIYEPDQVDVRFADLLGGIEGIESVEPTRILVAIATDARRDPAIAAALESGTPAEALAALRDAAPDLAARIDAYVDRYGDRSIGELKLESTSLREDPGFVVDVLRNYLTRPELTPDSLTATERRRYREARAEALARLGPARRLRLRRLLRASRHAVKQRERLRLLRTLAFGVARDAYRALGARLCEAGVLAEPGDILYLSVDEVDAYMDGRAVSTELRPIVAARRAEYERYRRQPPPPNRIRTVGAPYLGYVNDAADAEEPPPADGTLRGMGCCGGVAEAPVRVILDRGDELSVSGRILCTVRTDPGWTPLFPTASGIIVERGSQLSHSAVVAREFGIPTIVGVAGATQVLDDGETVRIDGDLGTVVRCEA